MTRAVEGPLQGALDGLDWRLLCLRRPAAPLTGSAGREAVPRPLPSRGTPGPSLARAFPSVVFAALCSVPSLVTRQISRDGLRK